FFFVFDFLWLPGLSAVRAFSSPGGPTPFTTLSVSQPATCHKKCNATNKAFWGEMVECFTQIAGDPDCRVVVVSGAGKVFTAGVDFMDMASEVLQPEGDDMARTSWNMRRIIAMYQETFTVIEKCLKPVVVAVKGACAVGELWGCITDLLVTVKSCKSFHILFILSKCDSLLPVHSVSLSFGLQATWNMSMLQTEDVMKSAVAAMEKKSPKTIAFSRL
uniref:Enoyl CoA hydratase 1, peroxisomal n=1 Tax=Oncorhynchus mykiss TaxID=8022 RepID=A0A8C7SWA2_ONCMY